MYRAEKFWDYIAGDFDKTEKRFEQAYLENIERTKRYLNNGDIVLDYACGTGVLCTAIADKVGRICAMDISSKMIDIARRKASDRKIENIEFIHATLLDKVLDGRSFDVVLAFNILHTLEDYPQIVQKMMELLKPGGLFIATTPCLGEKMPLGTRLQFYPIFLLSKIGFFPAYLKRFKTSELDDMIVANRLHIIESVPSYHIMTNYFVVARKM